MSRHRLGDRRHPSLTRLLNALRAWWWWLWTGHPSRESVRRELEEQVRRFGGKVSWED